jgi:putative membrane protein
MVSIITGSLSGIVTGMIPGLHVNTISAILVSLASTVLFSGLDMQYIVIFIAAMAITHTFFDIFPTLFLGIPGDTVFSLLPGHKMVKEEKGAEALFLSIHGSLYGILLSTSLILLFIYYGQAYIQNIELFVKQYMFWILLVVSIILIISDTNKLWGFIIFLLSGLFGIITMGSPLIPSGDQAPFSVLFPALAGLFGLSGLIQSLFEEEGRLPEQQKYSPSSLNKKTTFGNSILGTVGGMVVGFLPGLGSANAATMLLLIQEKIGKKKTGETENAERYLVSTSALNTADAIFAIVALYLISKSRSGASVAIKQLMGDLSQGTTITIVLSMLAASLLSFIIIRYSYQVVISIFSKLNYKALTISVIVFLVLFIFQTTGIWGIVVALSATFLGMIAPVVNARRAQAMGYFMIPVILYYSGYQASVVSTLHLEAKASIAQPPSLLQIAMMLGTSLLLAIGSYICCQKKYLK